MTDLEALIPSPVPLSAGSETIPVMPLRVRQFGPMMRAIAPVVHAFYYATREVDLPALLGCEDDVRRIVAIGIDRSEQFAGGFSEQERWEALLMVLALNDAFFFPEPGAESGSEDEAPPAGLWADTFQALIAAGHRWPDMQEYTLGQIRAFGSAAARQARERDKTALLTARAAGGDAALFHGWLNALDGTGVDNG